jgi:outer membrane protein OmpA-like peptidoglycan-associated protein
MTHHTPQVIRHEVSRSALVALAYAFTATLAISLPVAAQVPAQPTVRWEPEQKGKVEGPIMLREGDRMLVRQESSNDVTAVLLTDDTKIESPSGLFNIDRKRQDVSLLAPGLYLKVRGRGGPNGELIATRISFHKGAVKVQNSISAGEVELRARQAETAAQTQANLAAINAATARARDSLAAFTTRIANLDNYVVKFEGTVNFGSGSFELTDEAKQTLDNLVMQGQGLKGFVVEVAGYTDNTGSLALNQALSARRVNSVVAYVADKYNVPLRRFINPTGLGESKPIGDNDTAEGRAMNRRVEVRVLLNKGIAEADSSAR